ncbi:MAG: glycine cleavage system protein GcvH [Firmicutes bacterium]|nr:glycine cleavage system protein GcvH [Bacillota bacterium]
MQSVPAGRKYSSQHEWLDAQGKVGITAYAAEQLGDVVYVELPEVGTRLVAGQSFGSVESVKSVSELYSPVTGRVSAVNQGLREHPEWVNEDPYGRGWMLEVEVESEAEGLLDASAYQALIAREHA